MPYIKVKFQDATTMEGADGEENISDDPARSGCRTRAPKAFLY